MSVKQAVISDAGVSSRFLPIVKTIPKSFIPVGNKPIIQIIVEECLEAGLDDIIIVCRDETLEIFKGSQKDKEHVQWITKRRKLVMRLYWA